MWSTIDPLRVVIAVAIPSNPGWACCNEGRSKRTCGSGSKDTIVPCIWAVQTNHKQTTSNNNCQTVRLLVLFASFCHVASLKVAPCSTSIRLESMDRASTSALAFKSSSNTLDVEHFSGGSCLEKILQDLVPGVNICYQHIIHF